MLSAFAEEAFLNTTSILENVMVEKQNALQTGKLTTGETKPILI